MEVKVYPQDILAEKKYVCIVKTMNIRKIHWMSIRLIVKIDLDNPLPNVLNYKKSPFLYCRGAFL